MKSHRRVATLIFTCTALLLACIAYATNNKIENPIRDNADSPDASTQKYNDATALRNPINPISLDTLEQQASEVYQWLMVNAAHKQRLLPANDAHVRRIRAIMHRLIPYSLKWNDYVKNWRWQVNIIRSSNINADCLPGGKVIISSGLFSRLQLNDQEIAILLSHQIAHALREHARGHLRGEPIAPDAPQLLGFEGFKDDRITPPPGIGAQLLSLQYSHTDETEADVIGTDIAVRAGYDPRAAVTLWQRLLVVNRHTPLAFVEMHPFARDRIDDFKARLPDLLALYAKALGKTVNTLPAYSAHRAIETR